MADLFALGAQYENVEEVKRARNLMNKQLHTDFIINTNKKKSITLICKQGKKRKFVGNGLRPNQHVNFLGCKAKINLYKNDNLHRYRVTSSDIQHNHKLSEESDNMLIDDSDKELIMTLKDGNAKASQIQRLLHTRYCTKILFKNRLFYMFISGPALGLMITSPSVTQSRDVRSPKYLLWLF